MYLCTYNLEFHESKRDIFLIHEVFYLLSGKFGK